MPKQLDALAQARTHVTEGEARIARQKDLIRELAADGHDTKGAKSLLETLEATLALMREHLAMEEAEAAKLAGRLTP